MKKPNPVMAGVILFFGAIAIALSMGGVHWAAVRWFGVRPESAVLQGVLLSLWPIVGLVRWTRLHSRFDWPEWGHECLWLAALCAVVGLFALLPAAPWWGSVVAFGVWSYTVAYFIIIAVLHPILLRIFKAKLTQPPAPGTE